MTQATIIKGGALEHDPGSMLRVSPQADDMKGAALPQATGRRRSHSSGAKPAYSCGEASYSDREFAIFDEQGRFVNGKQNPKVHQLRSCFNVDARTVSLQVQGTDQKQVFQIDDEQIKLEAWLSHYFGFAVRVQRSLTGFPDDTNASGPTIISTRTLQEVASWFPGMGVDELRLRLRANIEIGEVPPFWEDQLFTAEDAIVQFQVGDVQFEGVNPCQRCIVPTRDPLTGEVYPNFQKTFVAKRREKLPPWATVSRFNHFFRLAVNTRVPDSEIGKTLQVGDNVKILGIRKMKFDPKLSSPV